MLWEYDPGLPLMLAGGGGGNWFQLSRLSTVKKDNNSVNLENKLGIIVAMVIICDNQTYTTNYNDENAVNG